MNKILFEDGLIIKDILLWVDLFEKKKYVWDDCL